MRSALLVGAGLSLAAAVALISGGCEGENRRLHTADELIALGLADQNVAPATLRRGRGLLVTSCAGCHAFKWPDQYAPETWPTILGQHGQRMSLAKEDLAAIEAYVVAASRAARTAAPPSHPPRF